MGKVKTVEDEDRNRRLEDARPISAGALAGMLCDGREIALVDVREAGQFGLGHPLHAISVPYSRLELTIPATGVENARLHDLRRTGATHLTGEGLSVSRFLVSQVLNHISDTGGSSAVTAIYDRNAYLAQKRRALDAWAGQITGIVSGDETHSNVVQLGL